MFQSLQLKRHLTRQAVDVTIREKKNKSPPVATAPIMLVAANSMASRTTESNTVPRTPAISVVTILHKLPQHPLR